MDKEKGHKNRLAGESSPYLLQHAGNPVDWYPWGEGAFNQAAKDGKPVFLSIGYSACHWCHVMAHESFEDKRIADYLNENFISVKVDREERPDIDHIYMQAVQALTGSGGWPLSVFLTSAGVPFFGGTYFPPHNTQGLPGFYNVLTAIKKAFAENITDIEKQAEELQAALSVVNRTTNASLQADRDSLTQAYRNLIKEFDYVNGGFGGAPKFPEPPAVEFLLRSYSHNGDPSTLKMAELTLTRMADGGIYDQLGGGFHRYSTDNVWRIPHFEKMLYDNALLSSLYVHAYQATKNLKYRDIACACLDYLLSEMRSAGGAFFSAQDADTDSAEGKYYIWTKKEIEEAGGSKETEAFKDYYGVTGSGNFDGYNVLTVANGGNQRLDPVLSEVKRKLLEVRRERVKPQRDEKILASWNGLMISALSEASAAFSNRDYLQAAIDCAEFITGSSGDSGILSHTWKDGIAGKNSFLEDYSCVIQGLMDLHAATWSGKWLSRAIKLSRYMIENFLCQNDGLLYDTINDGEVFFMRPRNLVDGATPSGNSTAAMVLLRLFDLTGDQSYEEIAKHMILPMREKMISYPRGFANWLCALGYYLSPRLEIAVCGNRKTGESENFVNAIYSSYLPNKIVAARDQDDRETVSGIALLKDREAVEGHTTVYLCSNKICRAPITALTTLISELKDLESSNIL
jgi:uncharacterized protein YyaL (SSP411 family)